LTEELGSSKKRDRKTVRAEYRGWVVYESSIRLDSTEKVIAEPN